MKKDYRDYLKISRSHRFIEELRSIRKHYQGRPTPVYHAARLSEKCGSARIYLKRENLNHTGALFSKDWNLYVTQPVQQ